MTKLVIHPKMIELANYDTLLQVADSHPSKEVDVFIQHDADTNLTYSANAQFSRREFETFVQALYVKYVLERPLYRSSVDLDAE